VNIGDGITCAVIALRSGRCTVNNFELLYKLMLDNDELWVITIPGSAILVADCSLMDN
jgi:hypothetical protein